MLHTCESKYSQSLSLAQAPIGYFARRYMLHGRYIISRHIAGLFYVVTGVRITPPAAARIVPKGVKSVNQSERVR